MTNKNLNIKKKIKSKENRPHSKRQTLIHEN